METTIKVIQSTDQITLLQNVNLTNTVLHIKQALAAMLSVSIEQQLLQFKNESLIDTTVLNQFVESLTEPTFKLIIFNRMVPLKIVSSEDSSRELIIKAYPSASITQIKELIFARTNTPVSDQTLTYNGTLLDSGNYLYDYNIKDADDSLVMSMDEINSTTTTRAYEIFLFMRNSKCKNKIALGIDFSFNYIKNVTKLEWDEAAPWYREVNDGLSWICYCRNTKCQINSKMFIANRGVGHFNLHQEIKDIRCMMCKNMMVDIRNMGFVNCTWQYKGELITNKGRRVYGDGKTYDKKFHTFKEINYKTNWNSLELEVRPLDTKCVQNIEEIENDKCYVRTESATDTGRGCVIV